MCVAFWATTLGSLKRSALDARLEEESEGTLNSRGVTDNRKLRGVKEGRKEAETVEVTSHILLTFLQAHTVNY